MTFKKVIALLLVFVLAGAMLVSCNTDDSNSKDDIGETSGSNFELFSNLPEKNYGGTTFTVYVEGDALDRYRSVEICPNDSAPSIISDAVAERNALVEQAFGVVISEIRTIGADGSGEMVTNVQNEIVAGTNTYDAVMAYLPNAGTLAANGNLYELQDMEYFHFDEPYWDSSALESLSVAGVNYFAVGDMNLLAYDCTHCIVFNKDVVAENNLDNPYDLVYDGTWTFDKLLSMAKAITKDSTGDGTMNLEDTWGFLINSNYPNSMYFGSGETLTTKDSDDLPTLAVKGNRQSSVFAKIFDICSNDAVARIEDYYSDYSDIYLQATKTVAEKRALFRSMAVVDIQEMGDFECNFGIIPTPKYEEDQENYCSYVSVVYASSVCLPLSVRDVEMSSIIIEALCQASTNTVKTNYYDNMLKLRKLQDDDGEAMLDIIFGNRVYELAAVYSWGAASVYDANSLVNFMNTVAFSGSNTFASAFEAIEPTVKADIEDFINNLD
ncbi:MAG: hypothetical protein PUC63_04495 [Clostridiales bacterium]|nr:hypothetical protein [Clostridiales bacterium]